MIAIIVVVAETEWEVVMRFSKVIIKLVCALILVFCPISFYLLKIDLHLYVCNFNGRLAIAEVEFA